MPKVSCLYRRVLICARASCPYKGTSHLCRRPLVCIDGLLICARGLLSVQRDLSSVPKASCLHRRASYLCQGLLSVQRDLSSVPKASCLHRRASYLCQGPPVCRMCPKVGPSATYFGGGNATRALWQEWQSHNPAPMVAPPLHWLPCQQKISRIDGHHQFRFRSVHSIIAKSLVLLLGSFLFVALV